MSSYEFAKIRTDTFQEDPLQLGRIFLDFPDEQKWVVKSLVFPINHNHQSEKGDIKLELLKPGETVAVFCPLPSQEKSRVVRDSPGKWSWEPRNGSQRI